MSQSLAAPTVGSAHFKLFLTSVLWGATWPAGRVVATHMPPVASASWRFSLAAILMLWLLRSRLGYWPRLTLRQYVWLGLCGAVGVLGYMICFMWGLSLVTAGRGSLVIALNPVVTALGAAWLLRERITPRMMLGMFLATIGALVVITHGELQRLLLGDIGKGEVVLLGCVLCWAAYSLMSKVSMRFTDSLTATCYPIAIGTVLLLFLGGAIDTHIVHYAPAQPFDVTQVAWQVWGSLIFYRWAQRCWLICGSLKAWTNWARPLPRPTTRWYLCLACCFRGRSWASAPIGVCWSAVASPLAALC